MADLLRDYEAILIVAPDLNAEAVQKVQAQFAEVISRNGGRVLDSVSLGRRKLSYKIGKQTEGQYLQVRVQLPAASLEAVRKAVSPLDSINRLMLVLASAAPAPVRPEGSSEPAAGTL